MDKPKKKEVLRKYVKDNLTGSMFWEYEVGCEADYNYNFALEEYDKYFNFLMKKIPSDKKIIALVYPNYAEAYYQGKFDILMGLTGEEK